jgi:hypothetical protein
MPQKTNRRLHHLCSGGPIYLTAQRLKLSLDLRWEEWRLLRLGQNSAPLPDRSFPRSWHSVRQERVMS